MRVAVAQMDTRAGDFDATVEAMLAYGRRAAGLKADLLLYPSPAFMGADPEGLFDKEAYLSDASLALARLVRGLTVPSVIPFRYGDAFGGVGTDAILVRDGEAVPLALASWLQAGKAAGSDACARALAALSGGDGAGRDDAAGELGVPGLVPARFSLGGVDVGVAFTMEDLDVFASGDATADVVCYLPTEGYDTDDEATCLAPAVSEGSFLSEASDANAWLVCADASGAYGRSVHCGGSFVLAPWGELAAVAGSFSEELLVADIDVLSEGPLAEPVEPPAYVRPRILWDACVLACRAEVEKRALAGAALVLDGTLASSALAALAVDAVGPVRVSALVCAESPEAVADARALAKSLRIRDVDELAWRDAERAADILGGEGDARSLVSGLLEARLGACARASGQLALSPADKTALAVGVSEGSAGPSCRTASFAPFGDVYRSDVARLARHRNTVSPVIPAGALGRLEVPEGLGLEGLQKTAELRLSELDAALLAHIERGAGLSELAAGRVGQEVAERIVARVREMEPWRRLGPRYPVVSACALEECAVPVADAWRERIRPAGEPEPGAGDLGELAGLGGLGEMAGAGDLGEVLHDMEGLAERMGVSRADEREEADSGRPEGDIQALDEATGGRISEVLGYLQELSAGQRMRRAGGGDDGGEDDGPWPRGLFSDN